MTAFHALSAVRLYLAAVERAQARRTTMSARARGSTERRQVSMSLIGSGDMPRIPGSRGGSSSGASGRNGIRLGQRYQDLDPRRPHRVGTVVNVGRARVAIRWDGSGHTTTVRRSHLDGAGSRGYVLIGERGAPPTLPPRPTTVADCRAGGTSEGRRLWRCLGCGQVGILKPPWRVLLWTMQTPTRGTVVCGAACRERVRKRSLRGS